MKREEWMRKKVTEEGKRGRREGFVRVIGRSRRRKEKKEMWKGGGWKEYMKEGEEGKRKIDGEETMRRVSCR